MKKKSQFLLLVIMVVYMISCATIRDGRVTTYQRTKPRPGEPMRQIKVGAFIWDLVLWGGAGVIIDFATGAIYKPDPVEMRKHNQYVPHSARQ